MARDRRFVAVHRGGPLDLARHRLLARWAADCAEHVLPLFAHRRPDDDRPRLAIEAARAWSRGEITVGEARAAAVGAHAAARDASEDVACAVARACGHAVATAHMGDHALGAAAYAVRAVKLASPTHNAETAGDREDQWQLERLPEVVRGIVVSALEQGSVLGTRQPWIGLQDAPERVGRNAGAAAFAGGHMALSVFPEESHSPEPGELEAVLGLSADLYDQLVSHVAAAYSPFTRIWNFAGAKYGWSLRLKRRDRIGPDAACAQDGRHSSARRSAP